MFYNSGKQAWTSSKDKQAVVVGIVDIGRTLFFTCGSCFHVEKTVPRQHVGCALWATIEKYHKVVHCKSSNVALGCRKEKGFKGFEEKTKYKFNFKPLKPQNLTSNPKP